MNTHNRNNDYHDSAFKLALSAWKRRKWLAILAFIVPLLAAISLIVGMPELYRAKATVLVKQDTSVDAATGMPGSGGLEARLQLINEEVLSRTRLQELIDRFDLYASLKQKASSEQVIERMRRDIRLEQRKVDSRWGGGGSTVAFTLSYQSWEPETAAEVANALASFYVEQNEKRRPRPVENITAPVAPRVPVPARVATAGMEELDDLKRELAELRGSYSESYPDITRLKAEIAALTRQQMAAYSRTQRAQVDASTTRAVNPSSVQREIEGLEAEESRLLDAIDEGALKAGSESQRVREFETLRQSYEETRQRRESLSRRYEQMPKILPVESRIEQQFQILDAAIPPMNSFAPSRSRLIFMALVFAFGIAGVIVILAEQLDTSFHRRDELWSYTNLPILASIPRILTRGDSWWSRLRFLFISVLTATGLVLLVQASYSLGQSTEQLVWQLAQRGV